MKLRPWAREHPLLFAEAATLALAVLAAAYMAFALWEAKTALGGQTTRRDEMRTLAREYESLQQKAAATKADTVGRGITPEELDRLARRNGMAEGSITSRSITQDTGATGDAEVHLVSLIVAAVSRQALAGFLNDVEQSDPAVRVTSLRITTRVTQPAVVDAAVRISAYVARKTTP